MLTENVVLAGNPTPAPRSFCSVAMLTSMRVNWMAGAPSARERHADAFPMPRGDVRLEGRKERGERWGALAQDLDVVDPYAVARACADV